MYTLPLSSAFTWKCNYDKCISFFDLQISALSPLGMETKLKVSSIYHLLHCDHPPYCWVPLKTRGLVCSATSMTSPIRPIEINITNIVHIGNPERHELAVRFVQ